MSQARHFDDPPMTIVEFDAFLNVQSERGDWELIAGRIVGTTNPSNDHGTRMTRADGGRPG